MELVESLNDALNYIERHLLEDADSAKAARQYGHQREA